MTRSPSDRSKLSVVYAIESVDGKRAYIGVTDMPLYIRVGYHLRGRTPSTARNLLKEPDGYVIRALQRDVAWDDRESMEDEYHRRYEEAGWTVVNLYNIERGWDWANAAITREQRQALGRTSMSKQTSEQHAAAARASNRRQWKCAECSVTSNAGGVATHQKGSGHTGRVEVSSPSDT